MTRAARVLLVASCATLLAACATTDKAMTQPVEMKFVGLEPGRPPMMKLRFDVTLHNAAAGPRWFLIPMELQQKPRTGGVDGVEVFALGGEGRVVLGRFQGTGGVQAILVPAGGTARIKRLGAAFDVVVARDLTVGGEAAAAWFGTDPTSTAKADVTDDKSELVGSRHTPDRREVPLAWTADRTVRVDVHVTSSPVH
jgi:hypothetical protein